MVLSSSSQPQLLQTDSTHRQLVRYWATVVNPNQAFLAMQGHQWALKVFSDQRMLTVAIASLSWGALSADKNIFVSIHFAKILFGGWKWTEKKQVHFLDSVMGKVKSRKKVVWVQNQEPRCQPVGFQKRHQYLCDSFINTLQWQGQATPRVLLSA